MTQLNFAKVKIHCNLIDLIKKGSNNDAKVILQYLSEQPKDLVDDTGSTLLHYAVKFNNIEIVDRLVQLGCKSNVFDDEGNTPLMLAIMNNSMDLVKILFKRISDAHYKKLLAVMFGCEKICPEIVDFVFKKLKKTDDKTLANLLLKTKCSLYHAVFLDRIRVIKIMLDNNCSVNAKNPFDGNSALHVAVARGDLNLVRLLIKHGADVNAINHKGEIPLNRAKRYYLKNELDLLKILVEEGSSLTTCDHSGRMQIFQAIHSDAFKILLRSNIDCNVQDRHGNTLMHYCAHYPSSSEIFPLLAQVDFNPNIKNNVGHAPLNLLSGHAKSLYDFIAIRLLLEKGADVNTKSPIDGIPPLHNILVEFNQGSEYLSCHHISTDCIRVMLEEYGADIQYVTNDGETILDEIDEDGVGTRASHIILSYIALLKARGTTIIEPLCQQINTTDWIKSLIESYSSKLEQLNAFEIHELVTVRELLICNEIKFRSYLRNKQLATKLRRVLGYNTDGIDWMFIEFLKIRMNKASKIIEWQQKAEVAFCKLVDGSVRFPDVVMKELMNYLSLWDMKVLAAVKNTSKRKRPGSGENMCKRKCE